MFYPRKLTVIYSKNKVHYLISNKQELNEMVNEIKNIISNSCYISPIIKILWCQKSKDFNLDYDNCYCELEKFFQSNLHIY
jgi:hypothetical protein